MGKQKKVKKVKCSLPTVEEEEKGENRAATSKRPRNISDSSDDNSQGEYHQYQHSWLDTGAVLCVPIYTIMAATVLPIF